MSLVMTKRPEQASRAIPGLGIARAPPQFRHGPSRRIAHPTALNSYFEPKACSNNRSVRAIQQSSGDDLRLDFRRTFED
jgi:hypothetical protein